MRRTIGLVLVLGVVVLARGLSGVKLTRWVDPEGRRPLSYATWQKGHEAFLDEGRIGRVAQQGFDRVVAVIVNADLFPDIQAELAQYQNDLVAEGYGVVIDTMRGLSHTALRTRLASVTGIVGALLVGELPVAWYEIDEEEFPCDIYFMDLNGNWVDSDGDGLYDEHTGSIGLEIWVGRLYARPLTWDDEVRLIRRYFAKDHAYRTGGLGLPDSALAYVDDDWNGFGDCSLSQLYPHVTTVNTGSITRASDYRTRLVQGYEWIQVCSHSSPWGHTFLVGSGYGGTVFNSEIYALRPHAHFYNLFACSGTRYVEENYSAGWDIFQDDYGLLAVGSAKTGAMIGFFADFYRPMAQDSSIGGAFRYWWQLHGEYDRFWHYGLNLLGDPTLKPRIQLQMAAPYQPPAPQPTLTAMVICPDPETDDSPALWAMPDNKVWVVWKSGRSTTNGRFDIYAARHDQDTWIGPYTIGPHTYWDTDPVLGLDQTNRPIAVWANFTEDYHYNLFWSYWNGSSWSTRQQMSDDPSSDLDPCLTRDSTGQLWCFWTSRRDYFADVFASCFNGSVWSAPANITHDSLLLHPDAATMPDGTVWVSYTKYRSGGSEIWARYKSGSSWIETGPVSGSQHRAFRPALTVGASGLPIVCWQSFDNIGGDIWFSQYTAGGWTAPARVDAGQGLDVHPAMMTDIEGKPWVVWMSSRGADWDIYYSYFTEGHWIPARLVEPSSGPDIAPSVCCTPDGQVWVAWQNLTSGNWDIGAKQLPLTGCAENQASGAARVRIGPNPFRNQLRIECGPGVCSVVIADATGRLVQRLEAKDGQQLVWDGTDQLGRQVPLGVYLVQVVPEDRHSSIQTPAGNSDAKVVRLR